MQRGAGSRQAQGNLGRSTHDYQKIKLKSDGSFYFKSERGAPMTEPAGWETEVSAKGSGLEGQSTDRLYSNRI